MHGTRVVSHQRARWPLLSLIPLGFGAWAPIYAGARARSKLWMALGAVWSAISIAGWIVGGTSHWHRDNFGGVLLTVGWIGAIATSFVIRGEYERRVDSPLLEAATDAEQRLADRRRALALARENPTLALEIGVGRPDEPGAFDAGLVDVNNAPVTALLRLSGVDGDVATRIIETRADVNGFSSVEDLGATLDLPGALVEQLRDQLVFLPRRGH
jgi:DNA uptake protein ComE-like DNA-binding protein